MSAQKNHFLVLFLFLLLSLFLTLGRVGTAFDSFALLTPDLGVYATLAAAQETPDLFVNDPFLSNEKNVNSYNILLVPWIKTLENVFGNYGTACAFLLPFFLFIHLAGWYSLGVAMFRDPRAGLLVSLLASTPVLTAYDYWGLILDALPRFLYQGLIPFVLALSIWRGHDLRWWPVILGSLGLLNYIHPLSTPAWALAIMLALWVSAPEYGFWQKARAMSLAGVVLLLVLAPFIFNYVRSTIVETSDVLGYEQTLAILQERFMTMEGDNPFSTLLTFFGGRRSLGFDWLWYVLWMLGLGGLAIGLVRRRNTAEYRQLRQLAAWMAGILFVGGFIPVLERVIFAYLRRIPPEFEILKSLRYLVPLILVAVVYALWLVAEHLRARKIASSAAAHFLWYGTSLLVLLGWGVTSQVGYPDIRRAVTQNLSCWSQAKLVCPLPPASMDFIDALDIIREQTPEGARIFSEGQEVAVRYYALRPLVFTYKDGAPLAYTDQEQLLRWSEQSDRMDELSFIRKFSFRRRAFVRGIAELAHDTEADYLLLAEAHDPAFEYPAQLRLVYSNTNYSLYALTAVTGP